MLPTLLLLGSLCFAKPLTYIDYYSFSAINLDLPDIGLNWDESLNHTSITYSNLEFNVYVENSMPDVVKYESSTRELFNWKKLNHIVKNNPKSIVYFKDSRTLLVPNDDILDMSDEEIKTYLNEGNPITYLELDYGSLKSHSTTLEPVLIPATSCLFLNDEKGSGSLSIAYLGGTVIRNIAGANANYKSGILGLTYLTGYKAGASASFSGTYSCNTSKGKAVRLFYRVFTMDVKPKYKNIVYDGLKNIMVDGQWSEMERRKYLVDLAPQYYCATEDKLDLQCFKPGIEFIDRNGNIIESYIK